MDESICTIGGIDVSVEFTKLMGQNSLLTEDVRKLWEKTFELTSLVEILRNENKDLKIEVNELNAYYRRSNIEIRNIPESIRDD